MTGGASHALQAAGSDLRAGERVTVTQRSGLGNLRTASGRGRSRKPVGFQPTPRPPSQAVSTKSREVTGGPGHSRRWQQDWKEALPCFSLQAFLHCSSSSPYACIPLIKIILVNSDEGWKQARL